MPQQDIRLPESFTEYEGEQLMSNYDGQIIEETATALKREELFSRYAGWNFNGKVWWDGDKDIWHCEVWCYGCYRETITANTLEEIMQAVSDKYGYE